MFPQEGQKSSVLDSLGLGVRREGRRPSTLRVEDDSSNNSTVEITMTGNEGTTQYLLYGMAFLSDGKYIATGGDEQKIRLWRVEDGDEVGDPMETGSTILSLATSQDGRWIVSGTCDGKAMMWNGSSANHDKENEFEGHWGQWVRAVDISSDGTRIATGSEDWTVIVRSLSNGQRLVGPLQHDYWVVGVKFSPDGKLIATATRQRESVRVYGSHDGCLLADFPTQVNSDYNQSIAWTSDSKRLFVLSYDGIIRCLDPSAGVTLCRWAIHSGDNPRCISLACNDTFIAASANSSISFWDTTTYQQIGSVFNYSLPIHLMSISANHDMAVCGGTKITLRDLCEILPAQYHGDIFRSRLHSLRAQNATSKEKIVNLQKRVQVLWKDLAISQEETKEKERQLTMSQNEVKEQERQLAEAKEREEKLAASQCEAEENVDILTRVIYLHEAKHHCEVLYADGHIREAAASLLGMEEDMDDDLRNYEFISGWLIEFTDRCITRLCTAGAEASNAKQYNEALTAYSVALSLTPSPQNQLLISWARMAIMNGSVDEALNAAQNCKLSRFHIYRAICDALAFEDRISEAVDCFRQLQSELTVRVDVDDEQVQWESSFRCRSAEKLKRFGDAEMESKKHGCAIGYYSTALFLDSSIVASILVKCCEARVGLIQDELNDAIKDIGLNPSSYKGHERKYMVLRRMGRHREAFLAFDVMLSMIKESPDPNIHDLYDHYLDITPLIRKTVQQTIRDIPRVLIDTTNGRPYDRTLQAAAFEELPVFDELRSSMTTRDRLDYARIQKEVEKFYEYVMFSHKWQPPLEEPTFQLLLENKSVDKLPDSTGNNKLRTFCDVVRSRRFRWCWSDTCCVNQVDKGVQQESVIAMFRWYRRAALTIVHLLGVLSNSNEVDLLWKSIWNSRGWTYQEYVASPVVQFYTEDWKPYRKLDMWNHKDSPIIRAEMERATNFETRKLVTLQPGLDRVREKLYLASKRETTREEDVAYSLFGIFGIAISVIYGEGKEAAVHRLLQHILTHSDNVTVLSWTGKGSSANSYLPIDLTVYDQIKPPHLPEPIEADEMNSMIAALQSSIPDVSLAVVLYERLQDLPPLSLAAGRLRLSGLAFPLTGDFSLLSPELEPLTGLLIYHVTTPILGDICIKTKDNLAGMKRPLLIHPWINPLLDEDFYDDDPLFDLDTRALRLIVRLRQPFGALLLTSFGRVQYKRVATDGFIRVQMRKETTLKELMDCVRTVDLH